MEISTLETVIRRELPALLRENASLREYILSLAHSACADKQDTDDRFMKILTEMRRDREEQSRKWAESKAESDRKWEEQNRKWEEQNRKWEEQNRKWEENQQNFREMFAAMKTQQDRHNSTLGALGARWGLNSERSFRDGLRAIVEESFGVKVVNVTEYDNEGEVFGSPDQVELDIIVYDGVRIVCEIKSSMSKSDMNTFDRKANFYEKYSGQKFTRRMVISPMVDKWAMELAKKRGIEVYSYAEDVDL